jgi:hypothetical protein
MASPAMAKAKLRCQEGPYNSNVLNILPLTTFRTKDLQGKGNSDSLFSTFCGKSSVFFEAKLWHHSTRPRPVGYVLHAYPAYIAELSVASISGPIAAAAARPMCCPKAR